MLVRCENEGCVHHRKKFVTNKVYDDFIPCPNCGFVNENPFLI